jgi:hypothetical protein
MPHMRLIRSLLTLLCACVKQADLEEFHRDEELTAQQRRERNLAHRKFLEAQIVQVRRGRCLSLSVAACHFTGNSALSLTLDDSAEETASLKRRRGRTLNRRRQAVVSMPCCRLRSGPCWMMCSWRQKSGRSTGAC